MGRILDISSYGICLFSLDILEDFLKEEKVRSKKILKTFQENHNIYLKSITNGTWLPFTPIDSMGYVISVESFGNEWIQKMEHGNFNIEIKDYLWITDLGNFYNFNKDSFLADDVSYQTLDGETLYSGLRFNIPSGKYSVSIKGFARKKQLNYPNANYGFLFSLIKVNGFENINDPREDENYNFNVADI